MAMQFTKATRKGGKIRLAIGGPAGSGKTTAALKIARGLGGRIACIDTERGSASLYSDLADFDALELGAPYAPERYIEAIRAAEEAGYDVLIIDSMTHEWNSVGGCLELVDAIAKTKYRGNSWSAWNEVTPRHRRFVDTILQASMHVICTIRSKTETDQIEENGRKKVVKLGMKNEQREGNDYEFGLVFELEHDNHFARATKDRTRLFPDPLQIDERTGKLLVEWLNSGAQLAPVVEDDPIVKSLSAAPTLEALKEIFATAYTSAKGRGDRPAADRYSAAKDKRKAELEAAALPPSAAGTAVGGTYIAPGANDLPPTTDALAGVDVNGADPGGPPPQEMHESLAEESAA